MNNLNIGNRKPQFYNPNRNVFINYNQTKINKKTPILNQVSKNHQPIDLFKEVDNTNTNTQTINEIPKIENDLSNIFKEYKDKTSKPEKPIIKKTITKPITKTITKPITVSRPSSLDNGYRRSGCSKCYR